MKRKRSMTSQKGQIGAEKCIDPLVLNEGRSFADLPGPILVKILLKLPVKRILICKCVSKTFRDLISDPEFAKLHFAQAEVYPIFRTLDLTRVSRILYLIQPEHDRDNLRSCKCCYNECFDLKCHCYFYMKLEAKFKLPLRNFELVPDNSMSKAKRKHCIKLKPKDQKYKIVNSCNGLLCLSEPSCNDPAIVCNPITGEFIRLPEATTVERPNGRKNQIDCGLGFSPVTKQYKVVRMFDAGFETFKGRMAEVHTLGTGLWKQIGHAPRSLFNPAYPTYVNGALHWFCLQYWFRHEPPESDEIVSFDIDKECFQSVPAPPSRSSRRPFFDINKKDKVSMGVLGDRLCICDASSCDTIKVWVMKNYGVKKSWTQLFSIGRDCDDRWPLGLYQPIKYMDDGALLMFQFPKCALIYYDPTKLGFKYFKVNGVKSKIEAIVHTPSFISLKDAVLGDGAQVLNINSRCAKLKLLGESKALFLYQEIRQLEMDTDSDFESDSD